MTKKIETQIWNSLKTITDIKEAWNTIDKFNLSDKELIVSYPMEM